MFLSTRVNTYQRVAMSPFEVVTEMSDNQRNKGEKGNTWTCVEYMYGVARGVESLWMDHPKLQKTQPTTLPPVLLLLVGGYTTHPRSTSHNKMGTTPWKRDPRRCIQRNKNKWQSRVSCVLLVNTQDVTWRSSFGPALSVWSHPVTTEPPVNTEHLCTNRIEDSVCDNEKS